jgi:polysaccharide chain length determinant protein (PEP-CTERM system associated)
MKKSFLPVRDYLLVLFRRKWAFLVPSLAGIVLGVLLWVTPLKALFPAEYEAVALLRRTDRGMARTASSVIGLVTPNPTIDALRVEILTWTNLDRVVSQAKMDSTPEGSPSRQRLYDELRKSIIVRAVSQGRGIMHVEVRTTHKDPALAAKIANYVADNYVEESMRAYSKDNQDTVKFLEQGSKEHLEKLHEAEKELEKFRQERLSDVPDVRAGIQSSLLLARQEQTTRQLLLTAAEKRLAELDEQMKEVPPTVMSEVATEPNPIALQLRQELAERKRQVALLRIKWTDEHPEIKQLVSEVQTLEQQLAETPERVPGTERESPNPVYQTLMSDKLALQQEVRAHKAAIAQVEASITAREKDLRDMAEQETWYTDLMRRRAEYTQLYEQFRSNLLTARTRLDVESQGYGTQVEIVAKALVPVTPSQKQRVKVVLVCILGGIAMGVSLVLALDFCDQSLRGREDAAAFLDVPVLASVPEIVSVKQVALRRGHRRAFAGLALSLLLLMAVAAVLVETQWPGQMGVLAGRLLGKVQSVWTLIERLVGRTTTT